MSKAINSKINGDYQLIILAIELVHKVFNLRDCNETLAKNPHVIKACEAARNWNELFIQIVISPRKGGK
jgi:hypothetical protein